MMKSKKSAFVVDDDPAYAHSISVQLKKSGYDVKWFASGDNALSNLSASLDLIVLDHDLGESKTGLQYLRKFKDTTPNVPVLFLSQTNDTESASQALWSGAAYYIEKTTDCVTKITKVLSDMDSSNKSRFQNALIAFRKNVFSFYNF